VCRFAGTCEPARRAGSESGGVFLFLHIGNNVLVRKDEVIGIFSIDSLLDDMKGKKFYNDIRQRPGVQDISEGKPKTIILTDGAAYISRISSATLLSRSDAAMPDTPAADSAAAKGEDKKGDKQA